MKALVIEDHKLVARSIERMLETSKIDCVVATTGIEAIRIFKEQGPFDLITVDGNLPDGLGWDVIATIRKTGTKIPPVLAYAAEPTTKDHDHWNRAGVTDILYKSGDTGTFMETVRRLLAA